MRGANSEAAGTQAGADRNTPCSAERDVGSWTNGEPQDCVVGAHGPMGSLLVRARPGGPLGIRPRHLLWMRLSLLPAQGLHGLGNGGSDLLDADLALFDAPPAGAAARMA